MARGRPAPGGAAVAGGREGHPRSGPLGPGSLSPQPLQLCRHRSRAGALAPQVSTVGHLPTSHHNQPLGSGDKRQRPRSSEA